MLRAPLLLFLTWKRKLCDHFFDDGKIFPTQKTWSLHMSKAADPRIEKTGNTYLVPAVDQAARVLVALGRHPSGRMTLTEICRTVGIHYSRGFSILSTLQRFHFVCKDPTTKVYSLGMGLIFLSQKVLDTLDLRREAEPFLARIASETGSSAFLGLIEDDYFYIAAHNRGREVVALSFRLGHRFPLYWGAHGKAILASLPDEECRELLQSGEVRLLDGRSDLDRESLEEELALCRKNGYAADLNESKQGIRGLASNVFGPAEELLGAFVVIGTFPEESVPKYGEYLAAEAHSFSQMMRGSSSLEM